MLASSTYFIKQEAMLSIVPAVPTDAKQGRLRVIMVSELELLLLLAILATIIRPCTLRTLLGNDISKVTSIDVGTGDVDFACSCTSCIVTCAKIFLRETFELFGIECHVDVVGFALRERKKEGAKV